MKAYWTYSTDGKGGAIARGWRTREEAEQHYGTMRTYGGPHMPRIGITTRPAHKHEVQAALMADGLDVVVIDP